MKLHFFQWPTLSARSSETLIFLHGMGGTGQIWRPVAAQLEDDFLCIAPDQRGHGKSRPVLEAEKNAFHAEDYAQDVSELINGLSLPATTDVSVNSAPAQRVWLIGHSMGVRTALALAHLNPERVKGIIAIDIGLTQQWGGGIGKPLADFIQKLPRTFSSKTSLREYLFAHCPDASIAQYLSAVAKEVGNANGAISSPTQETWVFPFDHEALVMTIQEADEAPIEEWVKEIARANIRTLFLRGAQSKVWLKSDYESQKAKFLAEFPHGPLTFEEWENCGHGLPFEQRARFIAKIREFIE